MYHCEVCPAHPGEAACGKTWKTYPYKYQVHTAKSPPVTGLAPHHPRMDHRVFYPFEMTSKSDMCSAYVITDHNPYCYSPEGWIQRMAQRLLEGEASVLQLFASNPFPAGAPAHVRVAISAVTPTSMADHKATGFKSTMDGEAFGNVWYGLISHE
eukprot:Skav221446  [mRNA]  locus=scaffold140:126742:129515:+ [translate_table: standard]